MVLTGTGTGLALLPGGFARKEKAMDWSKLSWFVFAAVLAGGYAMCKFFMEAVQSVF